MASTEVTSILLDRPCLEGMPTSDYFRIVTSPKPVLGGDGDVLVQTLVASADPYLRGRFKAMPAGSAIEVFQAGRITASSSPDWKVGDLWGGRLPLVTEQVVTAKALAGGALWRLTGLLDEGRISQGVGILGMPGATAYGGIVDVLRPLAGQTLFVSAAAGAVGSIAGQIAKKHFGCKVIGSAGGPAKCEFVVKTLGFDACIDYKAVGDSAEKLGAALKEFAPAGIDMYFENVGGIHFDAAFAALRPYGRIAVCGCISGYNEKEAKKNEINIGAMIYTFQRIEGFLSTPYITGQKCAFFKDMPTWMREGEAGTTGAYVAQETVYEGISSWPEAFLGLFTGANLGKVVVRVAT